MRRGHLFLIMDSNDLFFVMFDVEIGYIYVCLYYFFLNDGAVSLLNVWYTRRARLRNTVRCCSNIDKRKIDNTLIKKTIKYFSINRVRNVCVIKLMMISIVDKNLILFYVIIQID